MDEGPYTARVTNPPTPPTPRLISIDRQQILLRIVDVEKLIDEDHGARSVWELVGRLDLSLYHAQIEAVEGGARRNHTDPQLLVAGPQELDPHRRRAGWAACGRHPVGVESCRGLKIPVRDYLGTILPGLANTSIQRVPELTPTAWIHSRTQA